MKYIITNTFFIFLAFNCFCQTELIDLEYAYNKNSQTQLNKFLNNWLEISKPLSIDSTNYLQNDVYQIFFDFYNPFDFKRLGKNDEEDQFDVDKDDEDYKELKKIYEIQKEESKRFFNLKYVVVQNKIYFNVYNSDSLIIDFFQNNNSLIISKDSILNFRPNIKFSNAKALYLYPKYDTIINKFLGSKHYPLGYGTIMNPAQAQGESAKRVEFLNNKLNIVHGHWGGYWHIETHPYIYEIGFNKNKDIAKIDYRLGYEGGEAVYIKTNGIWKFKYAKLTWIE